MFKYVVTLVKESKYLLWSKPEFENVHWTHVYGNKTLGFYCMVYGMLCSIPACNARCFLLPSRTAYVDGKFVRFRRKICCIWPLRLTLLLVCWYGSARRRTTYKEVFGKDDTKQIRGKMHAFSADLKH